MLFRKKIERSCSYCARSGHLNEEQVICQKKGVVSRYESCRQFRYDPLKRIPVRAKPRSFSAFDEKDYTL